MVVHEFSRVGPSSDHNQRSGVQCRVVVLKFLIMKSIIKALFYFFMWLGFVSIINFSWSDWNIYERIVGAIVMGIAQIYFSIKMWE